MSKLELVLFSYALPVALFFPQNCFADISPLDQSQFTQSQLDQQTNRHRSETVFYGKQKSVSFPVYIDDHSPVNHFFPTGLSGDQSDVIFNLACRQTPHSGKTCVKIDYKNRCSQGKHWAGMYWQNPAYNWGYKSGGGFNLTCFSMLIFWARGEKGGEVIDAFASGGGEGDYRDSSKSTINATVLTNEWKRYEIDLSGKDLSSISQGFSWTANYYRNRDGAVFYLDDICYV